MYIVKKLLAKKANLLILKFLHAGNAQKKSTHLIQIPREN